VTFRLYDWNHVDARTGKPRPLQVDQAMACIDFAQGKIDPVVPMVDEVKPVLRERLFDCEHFGLWRSAQNRHLESAPKERRGVLVCIAGNGQVEPRWRQLRHRQGGCAAPAGRVGACCADAWCHQLVEISLPEGN